MWFMTKFELSYLSDFNELTCKHRSLEYDFYFAL